ncbi:SH3 domain-containing protein [uncultured Roseobacter sp.]|uniref:SH3 domain-containing protein n=1 Tax=uncultured Roseobacter sp. TaxID=114847 RepID=UPI003452C16F
MRWILVIGFVCFVVWALGSDPEAPGISVTLAPDGIQSPGQSSFDKPKVQNPPDAPVTPSAEKTTLFVSGSRVNVRKGPGTNHSVIGQLVLGEAVKQVSTAAGWKEIETRHGVGWMSAKYLADTKPKVETRQPKSNRKRQIALPTSREKQAARNEIIRQSLSSYPGSCPCPYNTDRAGRRCGKRSAWSKPGGYSPICYDSDVSEARLNTYFALKRGAVN